jgi:hypothetical protein
MTHPLAILASTYMIGVHKARCVYGDDFPGYSFYASGGQVRDARTGELEAFIVTHEGRLRGSEIRDFVIADDKTPVTLIQLAKTRIRGAS